MLPKNFVSSLLASGLMSLFLLSSVPSLAQTGPMIEINSVQSGTWSLELAPLYSFSAQLGDTLNISLSSQNFDTYLEVLSEDGQVLTSSDDILLVYDTNSFISNFRVPSTGTYQIRVSSSYQNRGIERIQNGNYILSLSREFIPLNTEGEQLSTFEEAQQKALWFYKQRNYEQAIVEFNRALALDETNAQILNERGRTYLQLGNLGAAIADFDQAAQVNPNYALSYINRADFYFVQGDSTIAIENYQLAQAISPEFDDYYQNLALAFAAKGDQQNFQHNLERDLAVKASASIMIDPNYRLEVTQIRAVQNAGDDIPSQGRFLIIELRLHNYTDQTLCLNANNFSLALANQVLAPAKMAKIREVYFPQLAEHLSSTGGLSCIPPFANYDTFISFDVPTDFSELDLTFNNNGQPTRFTLWVAENEGVYAYIPVEINGLELVQIQGVQQSNRIEKILRTDIIDTDNCQGNGWVSTEIRYEQAYTRSVQVDLSTTQRVEVRGQLKLPLPPPGLMGLIPFLPIPRAELMARLESEYTAAYGTGESWTTIEAIAQKVEVEPGQRVNYEVVWVLLTIEGYIEVQAGNQIFQVPYTIDDQITSRIIAKPVPPC